MNDLIAIYQQALVIGCAFALAVISAVVLLHVCGRSMRAARRALTVRDVAVFALLACVCTWAAQKRLVTFPRTDPTQTYLTDRGSYVDSETCVVHIDFDRIIVPDSATMFVDRIDRADPSAGWVNVHASPFGSVALPMEFEYPNATNFEWAVYTDWTPGPSVQTNGVWHAMWGRDRVRGAYIIPLRTAVRVDGETIATPKSKEDSHENK